MVQINAMTTIHSVKWPAIIKLHADDELIYIADAEQYVNDDGLRHLHVQSSDILIDSLGAVYSIQNLPEQELYATGSSLSLNEVIELMRLHLANHGTCCVAKFHAHSIREAIMSVFA